MRCTGVPPRGDVKHGGMDLGLKGKRALITGAARRACLPAAGLIPGWPALVDAAARAPFPRPPAPPRPPRAPAPTPRPRAHPAPPRPPRAPAPTPAPPRPPRAPAPTPRPRAHPAPTRAQQPGDTHQGYPARALTMIMGHRDRMRTPMTLDHGRPAQGLLSARF